MCPMMSDHSFMILAGGVMLGFVFLLLVATVCLNLSVFLAFWLCGLWFIVLLCYAQQS